MADNLNRPITIGGVSSTSDILGNRLTLGSQTYGWDCLNRMTSYGSSNSYVYRADGMRVSKQVGSTATKYFYDGQMGIEDQDGTSTVTDYGLGARGVDYISRLSSGVTTTGFPVYDAHGNMTACLFRSGSTYSLANQRSYDAWGIVRQGSATGDPKSRYCANLGHKHDDETGLIYMRARYQEPVSGRFLSEDPNGHGRNWFAYCSNRPTNRVDPTGCEDLGEESLAQSISNMLAGLYLRGVSYAFVSGSTLIAGFDKVEKILDEGQTLSDVSINYEELYEQFSNTAASQDCSSVTLIFNGMSVSPGGAAFLNRLISAAQAAGGNIELSTQADSPMMQLYWLVAGDS